jgi:hypothetical protein
VDGVDGPHHPCWRRGQTSSAQTHTHQQAVHAQIRHDFDCKSPFCGAHAMHHHAPGSWNSGTAAAAGCSKCHSHPCILLNFNTLSPDDDDDPVTSSSQVCIIQMSVDVQTKNDKPRNAVASLSSSCCSRHSVANCTATVSWEQHSSRYRHKSFKPEFGPASAA